MGSQQQFCLRWNNHQSNMLTVFDNLFQNEALVDVTLACEGLSLKAHKMVLSACSPYFQTLFIDNPCKHPIVILKDVRFSDLKALVDFMYKGEVNVSQEQLNRLLKTAETLKIRGLAEVTSGYCVDDTSTGNGGGGSGGASNSQGLGSSGVTGCSGATGSNGSGCSNLANSSHSAYDSRTLRGSPPPHPSSPPRKRKKVKHKAPRSIMGLGSSSTAATAAAASSTTAERAASHSEVEDSDGPDLIEPKVEITEDNFGPDKMHEHQGSSSTSRHNQQSPDQTNDEAEDMTLVQNMGAGPSGSRVMSNQKGSPSGHHSSLGPLITSTPTTPSDTSSPLLQSSNQVFVSPGHQQAGDYSHPSFSSFTLKKPKGGRPTILYEEEEAEIVQYIKHKAEEGNPVDIKKILEYGNRLLRREGRRPTGSMYMYCSETVKGLSIKWWRGFKKRHPGLPYTRQKPFTGDDLSASNLSNLSVSTQ